MITVQALTAGGIMANNPLQQFGMTGFEPEVQDITRQREMAKMLLQQGMNQNDMQGQMVSGRYVGASPWQGIAKLYQAYSGRQLAEEADRKQADLARQIRELRGQEAESIMEALAGRPEQKQILATEQNLPQGQTLLDDMGQPTLVQAARPEMKADPRLALARALKSETGIGATLMPSIVKQVLPEPLQIEREYELAKKDGFKGTFPQYLKFKENLKDVQPSFNTVEADGGIYTLNTKTGQLTQATDASGKPLVGKSNKLTEYEGKATNYGMQMANSAKEMKELEDAGYNPASFKNQAGISSAGTKAGNILVSKETQRYRQAMDNFANAYIRFQSGANVPEQEIKRNLENLMPAIGDSEEKLAQKARARASALEGIRISAGTGAKQIPNIDVLKTPTTTNPTPKGNVPTAPPAGIDATTWQFMTPAEKALWSKPNG